MGKNIEVSLEVFGNKRLTAVVDEEQLRGKSVQDVMALMAEHPWEGEDKRTLATIKKVMESSGGYKPKIGYGDTTNPVHFETVRLGDPVTQYVQRTPSLPNDQLRMTVLGKNVVGY